MSNIIVFNNVDKSFGRSKVIKHTSFKIREHSICGFIGPNGAGTDQPNATIPQFHWCLFLFPSYKQQDGYSYKRPGVANYSLGMKQRLSIAMSLVGNPEILIWDGPINGLDPEGIIDVRNLIHNKRNVTFLISSHILCELDKVIDDLILIRQGEIIYSGSVEAFIKEYRHNSLEESYLMCMNKGGVEH